MMDKRFDPPIKTAMAIQLLGGFSISANQGAIPAAQWRSHRALSLVKLLALTPGHRLHRDQVIDALWPDSGLAAATNNFHQTLYAARRVLDQALPGCLVLEKGFLSLSNAETHALTVDVEVFEAAASHARESQDPATYQAFLDLYKGDLLPDDRYEEWTIQPRQALRQTFLQLSLDLAKVQETRQDYPDGIATLLRLLAVDPSHEEAHCALMRLYALSGQRQKALRQYQTLREVLQTELEVEPSPATTHLYEDIQAGRIPIPAASPPQATAAQPEIPTPLLQKPHYNLPYQMTSFIGREKETRLICELLQHHRLVTLTGAGGTGKTRLALRAAENLLDYFEDGVFLVELAPLSDPELVVQTCAHTLELIKQPDTPYLIALIQYLQTKHLLLILDNCEHILAACSSLVDGLLKNCPKLTILATSREILNLAGESAFRVPSLTMPDPQLVHSLDQLAHYESVRLFVERAAQVSPDFSLTEENAPAIALICQRLDGIPLAIELAAGRARVLSAQQTAARLDHTFRLLTGGSRAVLPRQQTLKATIDWSYELLFPKERLLLQRLSVFASGWTLEAAEAVGSEGASFDSTNPKEIYTAGDLVVRFDRLEAEEVLDLLTSLVDKSLVMAAVMESGTRYRMLETIRQYGRDRLLEAGGSEKARDRHLAYFAGLTGQAEPHLRGKGQIEWLDRLEVELDNLRVAMEWSQGRQIDLGLQIAADLMWFWWIRNFFSEDREWLKTLLSKEEYSRETQSSGSETNRILQRARALRAYQWANTGNLLFTYEENIATIEESVKLLRKLGLPARRELAISLFHLLFTKYELNQPSPEKQEMLEIFQQEKMRFYYSEFLFIMQGQLWDQAEWSQLKVYLEESLAISREIEDLDGIAGRAGSLAELFTFEGNYQKAEILVRESIEISHRVKNRWLEAGCYLGLIEIELAQGSYEEAAQHSQKVQSLYLDLKEQSLSINILSPLQISAWARGNYEEAVRLGRQILELSQELDMGDKAITHYLLGRAALSQDDLGQAETLIKKAILESKGVLAKGVHLKGASVLFSLQGAAALFSRQGKHPQAVRLCGALDDLYQRIRLGLPLRERSENEEVLASARLALGEEAFSAAWKEGQAMTLEQAVAFALDEME